MRISKKWLGIGIAIMAVVGMFYYSQGEWVDGAPRMVITATIEDSQTGDTWTATFDINENFSPQTVVPMTAVTADVPAVNPNGIYTIGFLVMARVDGDADIRAEMTGTMGNGHPTYIEAQQDRDKIAEIIPAIANDPVTFFQSKTPWTYYYDGVSFHTILGSTIDGSVFELGVTAEGYNSEGAWSVGSTDVTIPINVGETGTINITIDSIDTNVTEV